MKLQNLRAVSEVYRQGLNLTRAGEQLNLSQPAISRLIQATEQELGVDLFIRSKKRVLGISAAGHAILPFVTKALDAVGDIARVAQEFASATEGELIVATDHTQAKYVLPAAISRFMQDLPKVRLRLLQGSRTQVIDWVREGEAHFSVATLPPEAFPDLVFFPWKELHRAVLVRADHPLLRRKKLSLADIARYPIVTYDYRYSARGELMRVFEDAGFSVNVVLSASDADMVKTYVELGLGLGIVAHTAFDPNRDKNLRLIDVRHLFPSPVVHVGVRKHGHLGAYAMHLIDLFAPELRKELHKYGFRSYRRT